MLIWCKGPWPDDPVPQGEPDWMYFEVEADTDCVVRMIDRYSDGRGVRDSVARSGGRSLVHADLWSDETVRQVLTPISEEEFSEAWVKATDKPMS